MGDGNQTTKTLETYLVINWKDEQIRARKTEPTERNLSPHEFAIPTSVEVVVPEIELPEISASIEVPRPNVESDIMEDAAKQADPEAWKGVADDVIDDADLDPERSAWEVVYELVGRTLTKADVLADPDDVQRYVRDALHDRAQENKAEA